MENLERIEQYVSSEMTADERREFESRCESDPALLEDLAFFLQAREAAKETALEARKKALLEGYAASPEAKRQSLLRYSLAIAAGLALLLMIYLVSKEDADPNSPEVIYAAHFKPAPISGIRGPDKPLAPAIEAYGNNQIISARNQALAILPEVKDDSATEDKAYFLLAQCYLVLDNPSAAIAMMDSIRTESEFIPDRRWYSALALLKMNQVENARLYLDTIANHSESEWKEEAAQILRQLETSD